ncbi:MAG: hypothetical protein APF76_02000 [Desulfitibacter sp. BRH_c19]|nr:MAG: hypothetical protein APF76_02000 [Desulfitibacter sp. BRH_c19]
MYNFEYEYKFDELRYEPRYEPLSAGSEPFQALLFLPEDEDKKDFYVTGVMPDSDLVTLVDESGVRMSVNQVIVTKPVADLLKLKKGDTVDIVRKLDGRIISGLVVVSHRINGNGTYINRDKWFPVFYNREWSVLVIAS